MKNRNLIQSFNNAVNGVLYTIKAERNMRIHLSAAVAIMVMSAFYRLTREEFLIICLTVAGVIICELFNTAVEIIVDIIVNVYHPKAKIVKDVAAGAVLVSAFVSLVVAYFIFFDRVSMTLEDGIERLKQYPLHMTVIALIITIILVLMLKAFTRTGTPFRGGMPSGHAAIAFSLTTAVALWTNEIRVTVICLTISLLLVQSRLEAKIHTALELLAGSILGFLITLLLFQMFSV